MKEASEYINTILQRRSLRGVDRSCEYYPCHNPLEDCTWCYCPFYSCDDSSTGGKLVKADKKLVWGCKDCGWVHSTKIAKCTLQELLKNARRIESIPRKKLLEIRSDLIQKSPSTSQD